MTSSYFQNARNSEMSELQDQLNSLKPDEKLEAVKQVIATMTYGKDMSMLFPHVVKCMETSSIEIKKLVYLYIINYAKSKADMTIMAINTFRKDAHEPTSPLLRALAVRTMGCIRIEKITEYLCESLKDALADIDPYVRKTAAMCVTKLFLTNPRLVKDNGFIRLLQDLLTDGNAIVVSNAIASLLEISSLTGKSYIRFNSNIMQKLLYAINECSEWGQVYILEGIARYQPVDSADAENIIERVIPRLSHVNPAVVLAAAKVVLKFLDSVTSTESVKKTTKRLAAPLVTLLSNSAEIQYVVLRNVSFIVEKRRNIFDQPKVFFVRHSDPIFVKLEKLEILNKITTGKNFDSVLVELREYANWLDIDFGRKAIRTIATIGVKIEKANKRALEVMLDILKSGTDYIIEESAIGLSEILRHFPMVATEAYIKEAIAKIQTVTEPEARAGYAWILGEYNDHIPKAEELLKSLIDGCLEEQPIVQLQILLSAVKFYVKNPDSDGTFITNLLKQVGEESENPDIRDRAYIYWRLLNVDPNNAASVLFQEKPLKVPEEDVITVYEDDFVDFLIDNMATTVSVYHKPLTEFIPENLITKKIVLSDDEGEKEEEVKPKKERKQGHRKKKQIESDEEEDGKKKKSPEKQEKKENPVEEKEEEEIVQKVGFDLLDFGDNQPADLVISSADTEFMAENAKGMITDCFKENQAGDKGTKGITISGSFVRAQGVIKMKLVVINKSSSDLKDITFICAKNSFGLTAGNPSVVNIPQNSKQMIEVPCKITQENLNTSEPPSCPFKIKVKLNSQSEGFIFELPCLLHVFFIENGVLTKENFKQCWQGFNKHKESTLDIPTLKSNCQNADAMKQVLESYNIGITHQLKKQGTEQTVLYCSCQTVNSLPIVMEISIPSGKPGVSANVVAKIPVEVIGPLVIEAVKFILNEPSFL